MMGMITFEKGEIEFFWKQSIQKFEFIPTKSKDAFFRVSVSHRELWGFIYCRTYVVFRLSFRVDGSSINDVHTFSRIFDRPSLCVDTFPVSKALSVRFRQTTPPLFVWTSFIDEPRHIFRIF